MQKVSAKKKKQKIQKALQVARLKMSELGSVDDFLVFRK